MEFSDIHECDSLCAATYSGVGRKPKPWCERFADKLVYVGECWLWRAAVDKLDNERNRLNFSLRQGDLHERFGCNSMDACRWIYQRVIGEIPEGLQLDHFYCNNWRCVNPFHLEPVTNLENNSRYAEIRAKWTVRDSSGKFAGRLGVA
ncbi:HNH endonuclease [Mycobacterium phage Aikoy]|nr:HNH endonuclease [Mycobacterium phage Aikoy]